jgi:hypothetical protein
MRLADWRQMTAVYSDEQASVAPAGVLCHEEVPG